MGAPRLAASADLPRSWSRPSWFRHFGPSRVGILAPWHDGRGLLEFGLWGPTPTTGVLCLISPFRALLNSSRPFGYLAFSGSPAILNASRPSLEWAQRSRGVLASSAWHVSVRPFGSRGVGAPSFEARRFALIGIPGGVSGAGVLRAFCHPGASALGVVGAGVFGAVGFVHLIWSGAVQAFWRYWSQSSALCLISAELGMSPVWLHASGGVDVWALSGLDSGTADWQCAMYGVVAAWRVGAVHCLLA